VLLAVLNFAWNQHVYPSLPGAAAATVSA
jgi:hypothetical protein